MRLPLFFAFVLLAAPTTSAGEKDDANRKYPFLGRLSLLKDQLPPDCKILEIPENETPVKGLKNGTITTNSKAFLMGDERMKDLLDPAQIEAMYVGLYKESNELGVFAWAFRTHDAAETAFRKLSQYYGKQPKRFRLWLVDKDVVWLWRDPGTTDACFVHFEGVVHETIKSYKENRK